MKNNDICAAVLAMIGLSLAYLDMNIVFESTDFKNTYERNTSSVALRIIVSMTTIGLVYFVVKHHIIYYKMQKINFSIN